MVWRLSAKLPLFLFCVSVTAASAASAPIDNHRFHKQNKTKKQESINMTYGSDVGFVLVEGADIPGVFVVFDDVFVVASFVQNRTNGWLRRCSSASKGSRSSS